MLLATVIAVPLILIHNSYYRMPSYVHYWEFVDDLKRVFTNALRYNKEHLLTDTTNTSKMIYDAAEMFSARVDSLIPPFTVSLADRLERLRLAKEEKDEFAEVIAALFWYSMCFVCHDAFRSVEKVGRKQEAKQQEEEKRFEQQLIDKLMKEDDKFAADYDVERKKRDTAQQIQIHHQNQLKKKLMPANSNIEVQRDIVLLKIIL